MPMAIIRLEPFSENDSLRYRLDKLFDSMDATRVSSWARQQDWIPTVEVRETDEVVMLQVALPGLEAKDIDIHVSQAAVLISGDRPQAELKQEEHLISSEFLYGKFRRVIPLNTKVKNAEAQADIKNGMLTLTIPKVDEERHRVVQIKLGEPQIAESVDIS